MLFLHSLAAPYDNDNVLPFFPFLRWSHTSDGMKFDIIKGDSIGIQRITSRVCSFTGVIIKMVTESLRMRLIQTLNVTRIIQRMCASNHLRLCTSAYRLH